MTTTTTTELGGTLPLTEVRDRLSEILDDVATNNSAWTITRHGRAIAVVLSADEYESLVETLNILSDDATMEALGEAADDVAAGRVVES